jgi:hypothetical protein
MTLEQLLNELEALEKRSTRGPWASNGYIDVFPATTKYPIAKCSSNRMFRSIEETKAALIAAARNALPKLIAVIKKQDEALKDMAKQKTIEEVENDPDSDGAGDVDGAYDSMVLMSRRARDSVSKLLGET